MRGKLETGCVGIGVKALKENERLLAINAELLAACEVALPFVQLCADGPLTLATATALEAAIEKAKQ